MNPINDDKSNVTNTQKTKKFYLELYKSLESRLSGDSELSARTRHLCEAWARIHSICCNAQPASHPVLFNWLDRHTARTVLLTGWKSSAEDQQTLNAALDDTILQIDEAVELRSSKLPWEEVLENRARWYRNLGEVNWNWGHPVLKGLLGGSELSDEEVLVWLRDERAGMLVARLLQLNATKNCAPVAASLLHALLGRATAQHEHDTKPSFTEALKREAGFTDEVFMQLHDIEFMLQLKSGGEAQCIEMAKKMPISSANKAVIRLQTRLRDAKTSIDKKMWKNANQAATLIVQVTITRCMVSPADAATLTHLVEGGAALAALTPIGDLQRAAAALAAPATSAAHLYAFARGVWAHLVKQPNSEAGRPLMCELYVRTITSGMNELEKLKLDNTKEQESRRKEKTLAFWFKELGDIFASSPRFKYECLLTAFSVHPSQDMYDLIKMAPALAPIAMDSTEVKPEVKSEFGSWANDSHALTNFVKTSETLNLKQNQKNTNVLSTAILSEGEGLGLARELSHDLAVLLAGPRVKTLVWDMDRDQLLENCRIHMEQTDMGTRALTVELKYLHVDPSDYMHLPEVDLEEELDAYYGIEKGYEHLVEQEPDEPETVWHDSLFLSDKSASSSSGESDFISTTRRKKKQITATEDDIDIQDRDPLSMTAETKRPSKKKERPHSKERSKRKPRKDKKERKERKKKTKQDPDEGRPLSVLVGLKIKRETVACTDSDYDSQGKSSLNSEGIDEAIVYDGQFSMDELKSPNRKSIESPVKRSQTPIETKVNTDNLEPIVQIPNSKISNEVKDSIHKLIQFRRQKETSKNDPLLPGPAVQQVKAETSSIIDKMRAEQLIQLQNDVNTLVATANMGLAPKKKQSAAKVKKSTEIRQPKNKPEPKNKQLEPKNKQLQQQSSAARTNLVPIIPKTETRMRFASPELPKSQPSVGAHQQAYQDFVRSLQTSIRAYHQDHTSNTPKKTKPRKVIKPQIKVVPVDPSLLKKFKKSSCAKSQQQMKTENAPNTFSRLSYMHKNKQQEKPPTNVETLISQDDVQADLHKRIYTMMRESPTINPHKVEEKPSSSRVEVQPTQPTSTPVLSNMPSMKQAKPHVSNDMKILNQPSVRAQTPSSIQYISIDEQNRLEMLSLLRQKAILDDQSGRFLTGTGARTFVNKNQYKVATIPSKMMQPASTPSNKEFYNTTQNTTMAKSLAGTSAPPIVNKNQYKVSTIFPKTMQTASTSSSNDNYTTVQSATTNTTKKPVQLFNQIYKCDARQPQMNVATKTDTKLKMPVTDSKSYSKNVAQTVEHKNNHTANQSMKPTDFRVKSFDGELAKVLDGLIAHRTPSRGPNALDVALKRDSFQKYSENNKDLRSLRIVRPSSTTDKVTKQTLNAVHSKDIPQVPAKASTIMLQKKVTKPSQNVTPKTAQTEIKSNHSKNICPTTNVKFTCELPKQDDPFISGLNNSDYDSIGELIDDELRREIGELSDEDGYNEANKAYIPEIDTPKVANIPCKSINQTAPKVQRPLHKQAGLIWKAKSNSRPQIIGNTIIQKAKVVKTRTRSPVIISNATVTSNQQPTKVLNANPQPSLIPQSHYNMNVANQNQTSLSSINTKTKQQQNVVIVNPKTSSCVYNQYANTSTRNTNPPEIQAMHQNTYVKVNTVSLATTTMAMCQQPYTTVIRPVNNTVTLPVHVTVPLSHTVFEPTYSKPVVATVPLIHDIFAAADHLVDELEMAVQNETLWRKPEVKQTPTDINLKTDVKPSETSFKSERKVLSEVQERLPKANDITPESAKEQERLIKKRLAIINRQIQHFCYYPPIPLTYSSLKQNKESNVGQHKQYAVPDKHSNPSTPDSIGDVENNASIPVTQKAKDSSNRQIMLKSSKVKKSVVLAKGLKKHKVRLKLVDSGKSETIIAEHVLPKSDIVGRIPTSSNQTENRTSNGAPQDKKISIVANTTEKDICDQEAPLTPKHLTKSKNRNYSNSETILSNVENDDASTKCEKSVLKSLPVSEKVSPLSMKEASDTVAHTKDSDVLEPITILSNVENDDASTKCEKSVLKSLPVSENVSPLSMKEASDTVAHTKDSDVLEPITILSNVENDDASKTREKSLPKSLPVSENLSLLSVKEASDTVAHTKDSDVLEPVTILSNVENGDASIKYEKSVTKSLPVSENVSSLSVKEASDTVALTKDSDVLEPVTILSNVENNDASKKCEKSVSISLPVSENVSPLFVKEASDTNAHTKHSDDLEPVTSEPNELINNDENTSIEIPPVTCDLQVSETKENFAFNKVLIKSVKSPVANAKLNINKDEVTSVTEKSSPANGIEKKDVINVTDIIAAANVIKANVVPTTVCEKVNGNVEKAKIIKPTPNDLGKTPQSNVNVAQQQTSTIPKVIPVSTDSPKTTKSTEVQSKDNLTNNRPKPVINQNGPQSNKDSNKTNLERTDITPESLSNIPASLKGRISIEELPSRDPRNPNMRFIRVKLPNGKCFKATVFGNGPVNYESLFANSAMKEILLNQISDKKRFRLSVEQITNNRHKVLGTQIKHIETYDLPPKITPILETVNLISDDEEDNNDVHKFKTEFGDYAFAAIEQDTFDLHQRKFSQKCTVKLKRVEVLESIATPLVSEVEESENKTINVLDKLSESLYDDIQPASVIKDNTTQTPVVSPEVIELDDDSSSDLLSIAEPADKISTFKNLLLKDLGVRDITNSSVNVDDSVEIVSNDSIDIDFARQVSSEECSDIQKQKCYVKLINCDDRVAKLAHLKSESICEEEAIIVPDSDDYGRITDNETTSLSRSESPSILDLVQIDNIDEPLNSNRSSPVISIFEAISALEGALLRDYSTSPVMKVYDMISSLKNSATQSQKLSFEKDYFGCDSEWHMIKRDIRKQSNHHKENNLQLDTSTDCESELSFDTLEKSGLANDVLTLKSIVTKYLQTSPVLEQLRPLCTTGEPIIRRLKRKLQFKSDDVTIKIPKITVVEVQSNECIDTEVDCNFNETSHIVDVQHDSHVLDDDNINVTTTMDITINNKENNQDFELSAEVPDINEQKIELQHESPVLDNDNTIIKTTVDSADQHQMESQHTSPVLVDDNTNITITINSAIDNNEINQEVKLSAEVPAIDEQKVESHHESPVLDDNNTNFTANIDSTIDNNEIKQEVELSAVVSNIDEQQFKSNHESSVSVDDNISIEKERKATYIDSITTNNKDDDEINQEVELSAEVPDIDEYQIESEHVSSVLDDDIKNITSTIDRTIDNNEINQEVELYAENVKLIDNHISDSKCLTNCKSIKATGATEDNILEPYHSNNKDDSEVANVEMNDHSEPLTHIISSDCSDDNIDTKNIYIAVERESHGISDYKMECTKNIANDDTRINETNEDSTSESKCNTDLTNALTNIKHDLSLMSNENFEDKCVAVEENDISEIKINEVLEDWPLIVLKPTTTYVIKKKLKRKSEVSVPSRSSYVKRLRKASRLKLESIESEKLLKKYSKIENSIVVKRTTKPKIDQPKSALDPDDTLYRKEYKQLLEYYSTIEFSYSMPYHIEHIDVLDTLKDWPINGPCVLKSTDEDFDKLIFVDTVEPFDPTLRTISDELTAQSNIADPSCEIKEVNFSMGFGEGSGRVIQNSVNGGAISGFSAATLSDVKQSQPVLLSVDYDDCDNQKTWSVEEDQRSKIKRCITYIQLKDKVRSFFKNTSIELARNYLDDTKKKRDKHSFPFDSYIYNNIEPFPIELVVQVVQVGQLPVSAAAQNPVTCDPRVTQVSDASPSQCSVESSPHDESQQGMKNEYTELTTADLTLPLVQDYAQNNRGMEEQDNSNAPATDDNIQIETELIKSDIKIELVEESPEEKEDQDRSQDGTDIPPLDGGNVNAIDYNFSTNDITSESDANIHLLFSTNNKQSAPETAQQKQQNGSSEKTDQIAHAMNAAGITTSETITNTSRAHALVNILSQKIRQGGVQTTTTNTYSKTSINAMALQQALAQILPPPLNQTGSTDSNQQGQNQQVTQQVLHIVQGKNSTGNQITLVDNSQQSVISNPNATPVLHIVQNKSATGVPTSNGTPTQQQNTFSGISLVDAGLQQGGNQLLHIVNTGSQKNNNAGQLLKRVNLLTNLTNVQGSNEQKMVQFVCKSADGKAIQLNAPHQRSMVLRLQPIETPTVQPPAQKSDTQDNNATNATNAANKDSNSQEIKSRSVYEENYAKFIQNSTSKSSVLEKSTSLPKFNQAFGKPVFQDGTQKPNEINSNNHLSSVNSGGENTECPPNENSLNLEHINQISSPPLLLRKSPQTSQAQTNLVQQIKQTIAPMNIQTMHGGVIYTRQIPVNIGGGQTINLITVPSTELIDDSGQKQASHQGEIEPSIIKIVPQSQPAPNTEVSNEDGNNHLPNENAQNPQPQPVLTQMRIKLPMLSKTPQMVSGARVVRPSFFQIQRNVIGGANQPVYQQLVLTAAPPLGQQTIRLPQAQAARQIKIPTESESQMSSSTLEQLREFDMVLEQVKERSTVQPNPGGSTSYKLPTTSTDTTDNSTVGSSTPTDTTQQVLYSIGNNAQLNVAYVNRKTTTTTSTTSAASFVRSPDSSGIADSPTSSTLVQIAHTAATESSSSETSQPKPAKVSSKSKSRPKSSSNPPNSMKINTVPPKPSTQKPLEDEQTTQRILYILAEYKEQVENSPDKDKPAPRRRSNPPSNPSGSSKRKKSSSCSRRPGRDMSPVHGDDTCRTMGSEDSSCGTSQGDCNESCLDSHSPQDSPRKVVRKLTFEQDPSVSQPRPQPQRNVIVADGQTITVARGTAGKPATAVLMPANYILPVSMVKGGQQIAIVTNRGPKLLTVGGGEGGATNALLLQRLIGPAGLKPMLTRPGVRHVRLPTAALHNLQTLNFTTTTTVQPPDSTASPAPDPTPPELVETRPESSPWTDCETENAKPDRASSPDGSEPWNLPSSADPHEYTYEETVRADNLDRTVLDPIPDRYSPDMEAQRIFDKMFDIDSKKSYIVDSQVDSPRCGYDIDASDDDKTYQQVVQKKDGSSQRQARLTHVSAAALRHKYAILEHELRLQKSLSEECEDLGVDSPSAAELFPEAELLFAASPAHEPASDTSHAHHVQPPHLTQSAIRPDMDDQMATDQLLPRQNIPEPVINLGLEDVGIVTVSEDGIQANITLDQEEFARAHPNTTFHSEPTDDGEVQPFSIAGLKGRHISSAIFHANRAPATVLMTAMTQPSVISQATEDHTGKYSHIDNMIHSIPSSHSNLASVLVKDDGLTRFDNILTDSQELHLSNTASAIVHSAGNATQVIRRVCYDEDKRERDARFLMDEPDAMIAGDDAKMIGEDSSRDATLESIAGDVDDDNSSPERHAELYWESNSASERSESRRPLDFSSDSDKCCKSPSFDETNSTDSSGVGAHMRLDSVIKEARLERSGSAGSSADDVPPLRTYPAKRMYHSLEGESLSGKTRAPHSPHAPHSPSLRRRASGRGVVKRGCHCCNGEPAPPRPKKAKKKTMDFTHH